MLKSFRLNKGLLNSFVQNQVRAKLNEDYAYKSAYLAKLRQRIVAYVDEKEEFPSEDVLDKLQDSTYEYYLKLFQEHWELAKADHLEQIYAMVSGIHKIARKEELVINKRYEEISEVTAIIDPDKFPIFNLIDKSSENDWVSVWEYKQQLKSLLKKQLGFMLEIEDSRIEHHEAGKGVFLKLEDKEDVIVKGTLLGFVPGVIHSSFEPVENETQQPEKTERRYITRYDGTSINYGEKLPYPFKLAYSLEDYNEMMADSSKGQNKEERPQLYVPGEFINPYACGHYVNHPPPNTPPNVIFLDLIIPNTFFPQYFMRYLPYIKLSSGKNNKYVKEYFHRDCYHGLGIFALENLKHDDELYVDYMEYRPDWLTNPPPLSPYLSKYEYENKLTLAAKLAAAYLMSQDKSAFDQHMEKIQNNESHQTLTQEGNFIRKKIVESQNKKK